MNRRTIIKSSLAAASLVVTATTQTTNFMDSTNDMKALKNRIKHSACRWCYSSIPLEKLVEDAQEIGLKSIELLDPNEWKTVLDRGLTCAISNGSPLHIQKGFNDVKYHAQLYKDYAGLIPMAADHGITQIICFSGNRENKSDLEGIENCAKGLDPLLKIAEKHNIRLVMELLNSKVDHKDYQCDHTEWGVSLVNKIGSPNFKLLYDIYHMQIMEGDVIATIRKHKDVISHFHTGGVPGRHEINETQELNYKAIMQAIVETGFTGFVAQEFIPTRPDMMKSLKEGIKICDV